MTQHLLVGFDGSDESRRALAWAIELARQTGAAMDIVAVARPPEIGDDVETEALIERARSHYHRLLGEALESAQAPAGARPRVLVGHPAEQLVRYAEDHGVDHIVLGHRHRGAMQRWWMGSVSRQVGDHATCSVTIVR